MHFLDELMPFRLYNKPFYLPLNMSSKLNGSCAFLMTPSVKSTEEFFNYRFFTNKYYNGYYIERAVMYYINHENGDMFLDDNKDYVTEDIKLVDKDPVDSKFIINGYTYDIDNFKQSIGLQDFDKIAKKYKVKLPKEIYISIRRNGITMEFDKDQMVIANVFNFNKKVFNTYKNYCNFCAYCYIARLCNPIIDERLMAANAIYETGIYDRYKNSDIGKWPLSASLKMICVGIANYRKDHSYDMYIKEVIKRDNGLFKLEAPLKDVANTLVFDGLLKGVSTLLNEKADFSNGMIQLSEDVVLLFEVADQSPYIKKILYNDRIKSLKELTDIYKEMKAKYPFIKYTYVSLDLYKSKNLFFDLSGYNYSFVKNNVLKNKRGYELYMELMKRMLVDSRFTDAGYTNNTIVIPVLDWHKECNSPDKMWMITETINPISCIYYAISNKDENIKTIFSNKRIIFTGDKSYFTLKIEDINETNLLQFLRDIKRIITGVEIPDDNEAKDSEKAIVVDIIDKVEKSQNIEINNIETTKDRKKEITKNVKNTNGGEVVDKEAAKKEIVKSVEKAAKGKASTDDALNSLDKEDSVRKALSDLASNPDNGSDISAARASRLLKLQDDFIDSEFQGRSVRDILYKSNSEDTYVAPKSVEVDSVNEEWKKLNYIAAVESYDLDGDILKIFRSLIDKTKPLSVMNVSSEDTSTSEDAIVTYTCNYEDYRGKRYKIVVDIPKILDNRYMTLRGNRKTIQPMLFLMPIIKTEEDTAQIVSCYNKIYIRRFGTTTGKSNVHADKLIKVLTRNKYNSIKITEQDNSRICSKYELPIDYIDIASVIGKIETKGYTFYFNQDEIREKYEIDDSKGLPVAYSNTDKSVVYWNSDNNIKFFSVWLFYMIAGDSPNQSELEKDFNDASTSVRYTYSRASILSSDIPLVVVCAYSVGLEETMRRANIEYTIITDKRPSKDLDYDILKFKDGWIQYKLDYNSSLLMNGLKQCPIDEYSIDDINMKSTYVDFLDLFGGRIKADGLDNFYDCMVDPITYETLQHYKLPTNYIDMLLYSNMLLADNKFVKHGDIRKTRRIRRIEQIADFLYKALSSSYGSYSTGIKHGRDVGLTLKRSAVIDTFMTNSTTSDQSILNANGEFEDYNAVTPKGSSGMNSDRAYSLDKRSFDDSMLNVLSTSTGFAGTVGVTRQATIDANVQGPRGYIYNDPESNINELNGIKSLCMTEALTPFGTTRDDPMRTAMNFIQTSKHTMRTTKSDPLLITNGADEALPYLISDTFAYKAKMNGKVLTVNENYMVLEYTNGSKEVVNLSSKIEKNSSSGFYVAIKLDTDLKEGKSFKAGDIVAYDKESFTDGVGSTGNISYMMGPMIKFAIMNTDEGYEDSAAVSEKLSEDMASDVIVLSHGSAYIIQKDCDVFNLVKKGQAINEGDELFILQNAYDDEDANALLRALKTDNDVLSAGRVSIKSKYTGIIQDIIIKRTVETNELSPSLKKIVNEYEGNIKRQQRELNDLGAADETYRLPTIGVLPATGKLKKAQDSISIEIYTKYHDKFGIGDKMIYGAAVKGVDRNIFPLGLEPVSDYRPEEKVDALLSIGSLNARMVTSVQTRGLINKGLIELTRQCKEILGLPTDLDLDKKE